MTLTHSLTLTTLTSWGSSCASIKAALAHPAVAPPVAKAAPTASPSVKLWAASARRFRYPTLSRGDPGDTVEEGEGEDGLGAEGEAAARAPTGSAAAALRLRRLGVLLPVASAVPPSAPASAKPLLPPWLSWPWEWEWA